MKKTVEQRFPTKKARDIADKAIDDLDSSLPMSTFIDTWLLIYRVSGGVEK